MKYLLLLLFLYGCESNNHISTLNMEDQVKQAIIAESNYSVTRNSKEILKSWKVDNQSMRIYTYPYTQGIIYIEEGYEEIEKTFSTLLKQDEYLKVPPPKKYDWNIKVYDNVAWANFTEEYQLGDISKKTNGLRILELINGAWKIVYSSTYIYDKERDLSETFKELESGLLPPIIHDS